MKSQFVIFVIIGTLLVAAIYSASTYFVFAAQAGPFICSPAGGAPGLHYCVDTKKQVILECHFVGKELKCIQLTSSGDIPPDLRDALVKAESVEPGLKGGNTTEVPKGSFLNDGGVLKGQDDNQSTSKTIVGPQDRFCVEGTGGDTGSPCLPCDPGLKFEVGCIDVTTGGPLDMRDTPTSEEEDGTNPKDLDGSNNDDNGPQLNPGE
ncbi:MAG TPA: hypothetical protein VL854_13365 [Nitrososphaeraceae archaeon]|jgi:hypothetical protein|nr:hypothetical protein [Nitrososphaeraceae archaeon]